MSTFHRIARLTAGCALAVAALTGCSDDPEPTDPTTPAASPTPEPSAEPSSSEEPGTPAADPTAEQSPVVAGGTFTGTGYELVVPDGWRTEPTMSGGPIDVVLVKDGAETTDGIAIVTAPASGMQLDDLLPQARTALEGHATDIADAPAITIDGQPAQGFTGTATQGNVPFVQYYVVHNDQLYEIDFAGPDGVQTVESLTGAWTFTS